jgi:membrane associated rhomboid family serine protease
MDFLNPHYLTVTNILIGITVIISWSCFNNQKLMQALMMNPYLITTRNQYYRFLTSGFIHKDTQHLFFNMFSFYFFGTMTERDFHSLFGSLSVPYFIILYCLAIVVSDLPTYVKERHNPSYNSLGASGGVSAIIFVSIFLRPLETISIYLIIPLPGFVLGILYIGYSWYQGKQSKDSINHYAHLYGALFGLLFCIVLYPDSIGSFIAQIRHWNIF